MLIKSVLRSLLIEFEKAQGKGQSIYNRFSKWITPERWNDLMESMKVDVEEVDEVQVEGEEEGDEEDSTEESSL